MLQFAAAKLDDVIELAGSLRECDKQEVEAATGDVANALLTSLELSDDPVTARTEAGGLVCVFGAAPTTLLSTQAAPWLLGTDQMRARAKDVFGQAQRYLAFIRERYPVLVNYVDARNTPSVRWLRRLGFTVEPAAPFGYAGLPFHRFHMGLDNV